MLKIYRYLLHLPNLIELNLHESYIFEDAVHGLFNAKPPNPDRKLSINLSKNVMATPDVLTFAVQVSEFSQKIQESVKKSTRQKSISSDRNYFILKIENNILQHLVYNLWDLDVSGMRLRSKGISTLLPLLTKKCPELTSLSIGKNLVSSSEAEAACEAIGLYLAQNKQLRRLAVTSDHLNYSYKSGMHKVFEVLDEGHGLEELDISSNYTVRRFRENSRICRNFTKMIRKII